MAGTIVADQLQDGAGNSTSMDNAIYGSAKAWVRFNGVTTTTINASYNVSSVTRTSAGYYTVNFTNAFSDANYCVAGSAGATIAQLIMSPYSAAATTTTSCQLFISNTSSSADNPMISALFFR